jgi:gluconate 5-dehydrogenase
VLPVAADVARADDVQRLADATLERFGRVDVLVNNAGISPVYRRAELVELSDWQRILEVNLTGVFLCCQAFGRIMLQQQSGSVVNMSSLGGRAAFPRLSAYCASKGGVDALTRVLALEWARSGVRVNALGPAFLETDMTEGVRGHEGLNRSIVERTPLHRMGMPDEVVGAALFLASEASSYVTGQTLYVDGGWLAG